MKFVDEIKELHEILGWRPDGWHFVLGMFITIFAGIPVWFFLWWSGDNPNLVGTIEYNLYYFSTVGIGIFGLGLMLSDSFRR